MKHMTAREIILDTVEFYKHNPRAYDEIEGSCVYFREEDNSRCAVGRFSINKDLDRYSGTFKDFYLEQYEEYEDNITGGEDEHDQFLEEKVRGQSLDFWNDLQLLHDVRAHWTREGRADVQPGFDLTEEGEEYLKILLNRYG